MIEPVAQLLPLTSREIDDVRRAKRFVAIVETIPAERTNAQREGDTAYTNLAVAQLGKNPLKRVVWPWSPRPVTTRGLRGKVR